MKVVLFFVLASLSLVYGARYRFNHDICHLNTLITKNNLKRYQGGSVSDLEVEMTKFCRVPSVFCRLDRYILGDRDVKACCVHAKRFCVGQSRARGNACGSYCQCWKKECDGHF
uniref:Uncharacterized protein n=1 Tax=Clytia hemisphaerica TaxID=252671 RepID=A0A7M5TZS8_9CNID|eukprot:TCONS_00021588-protein